jgi:glutamate-1-semialdehyde aminotransferase
MSVEKHEKIFPFGCCVSSKSRTRFAKGKAPEWIINGFAAQVQGDNFKGYLDLTSGLGSLTIGHVSFDATPRSFPLPCKEELHLAEFIQDWIPWAESMRFAKNGSDVTMAAVRLARIYTGRDLVVDFGNYHGCQDTWITPDHEGVPQCVRDLTLRLPPEVARVDLVGDQVACVILEALPLNPLPEGFLTALRARCTKVGAVLVFDDVISGFRAHPQGAAGVTGVIPDLTCAGKAMGNGWPISVIYGKAEVMKCWERTHLSATHWADPTCMLKAQTVLQHMKNEKFWERQAAWTFGGMIHNGYWSVTPLDMVDQTFVQGHLLDAGIITNFSQFYYLALDDHKATIENAFRDAFNKLNDAKKRGDDIKSLLTCEVNRTLFRRN